MSGRLVIASARRIQIVAVLIALLLAPRIALAQQSRSLQNLLDLRSEMKVSTLAASVIAGGASPEFRTITIDKGTESGLGPDMAVISPAGVVGRVLSSSARASKVQLLIDRNAAAGGLVDQINGFIGQESICDIARGQVRGDAQGLVRIAQAVVFFKTGLQAFEYFIGVIGAGFHHVNLLESTAQGLVLLENSAVFVKRGGTDAAQFPRTEQGL